MKNKLIAGFIVFTAISMACTFATGLTPSGKAIDETPTTANIQIDGLSAETTVDGSILLKWEPISGAEKYLVEVQIGDDFVPLAVLPSDQTSYEDKNVPPATRFTYRLSSLVKSERGNSKEITVETSQEAGVPIKVSIEFDQTPASFDPSTFDPSTIDPNTFDPDTFDPSMFVAQPVQTEALIGPQGGEVSVTGSNGVIYTLNVPPDALRYEVPITLRPISAIADLPLSGGLMSAVFVEPETLVFDVPATLTMIPPADFPAPAGPLVVAFSFENEGQEFHLYPFDKFGGQSSVGGHLASLGAVPDFAPPLSDIAKLYYGGGYGHASATNHDVQVIAKKPPSKPQNRTAQRLAVSQLDELTPLSPIEEELAPLQPDKAIFLGKIAESILQKAGQADDWSKFMEAVDDFSTYINAGGDKYEFNRNINGKILDMLVEKAGKLLEKNKGDCLTYDDFKAQELVERLTNPKDSFSKIFAERFKQKNGQKLLDDLAFAKKTCTFELKMQSTLTFDAEGSTLHMKANAPKMKLFLIYSKGEIYLSGGGPVNMQMRVSGSCSFPLKHYDSLTFSIDKLSPVFENGLLTDFALSQYAVHGWNHAVSIKVSEDKRGCPTLIKLSGGGDYWTGLFTLARFTFSNQIMTGWKLQNGLTNGSSLKANWESVVPSFSPMGVDGKSSEDTKFELIVTKNSR